MSWKCFVFPSWQVRMQLTIKQTTFKLLMFQDVNSTYTSLFHSMFAKGAHISGSKVHSSNMEKNYERRTVEIIHPQLRFYIKFFSYFTLENHNGVTV